MLKNVFLSQRGGWLRLPFLVSLAWALVRLGKRPLEYARPKMVRGRQPAVMRVGREGP